MTTTLQIRDPSGKGWATVTGSPGDDIRRHLDRLFPGIREVFESEADAILDTADPEWPRRTGKSWAGFEVVTRITKSTLETSITNAVPYVRFIQDRKSVV